MDKRRELGEFLKARRARLRLDDVGLAAHGRRRVAGLRREELAQLAGVSVDYYVRLEQGRVGHPSDAVLDALARALRLDDTERAHLYDLTRPDRRRRAHPPAERVRPQVRQLLGALDYLPAAIIGRRMDVLAWTPLAAALIVNWGALPPDQRNTARHFFLDDGARELYADWDEGARMTVGFLRRAAGRHPDDLVLAELIGELSMKSEEFRRLWPRHDVRDKAHGTKRFQHPVVGPLSLAYESLALPADGDQTLFVYTAEPGSPSDTALHLLASTTPRSGLTEASEPSRQPNTPSRGRPPERSPSPATHNVHEVNPR